MAYTYEDVIPTKITNTTMQKRLLNGVHRTYLITPNEGYILHDNIDEFVDDDGSVTPHFSRNTCTCAANYDFDVNPREFYAILESEAPENAYIYGGVTPDTEVM